jgi:hypothetical protein
MGVLPFLLIVTAFAHADTYVSGTIKQDTTWDLEGSPYLLSSDVTIAEGVTLTVEGGVVIKPRRLDQYFNQAHLTHLIKPQGPRLPETNESCITCHTGFPVDDSLCEDCHSEYGAFDGLQMGIDSWADGVYAADGTLKAGKENWCLSCHDDNPNTLENESALIDGIYAPNVAGDENNGNTYGFNLTGHNIDCLSCHEATADHIDGEHRTYQSELDNYQAGYRLRSVDGGEPMNIPRPKTSAPPLAVADDFALCGDCHNLNEVIAWDPVSHTNFWNDPTQVNSHIYHLKMYRSTFDSDWDKTGDSEYTCVACHNVHGSPTAAMIRHGELISTYGTTDKVPSLNFSYLVPPTEFATATWNFSDSADSYYVYVRWTSDSEHPEWRASNAKYTINYDGGGPVVDPVNQQTNGGTWNQLGTGTYSFVGGNSVVLSNEGADGPVVADAIGWDGDGVFVDDWDSDGVLDPEIVVDNPDASFTPSASAWTTSSWTPGYHGTNYQYHEAPVPVPNPNATLVESIGGIMDYAGPSILQNGVCGACHGAIPYYREPYVGPHVIFPKAEPASVDNDNTTLVLLMAHVLDKDDNLSLTDPVVINLLAIDRSAIQPMYDDGTNGDQEPNDGIFTYQTTVPGTVDVGDKTLTVTATDQDGGTSQGDLILTVTNPNIIIVDNDEGTYTEDHGPWTTSSYAANYYPPDYQWHAGGAGDDYFQWTPTITIPGTYEVSVWYPVWESGWSWATDAAFTVYHDGGSTPRPVNQQAGGGTWVSLGTYDCDGINDYVRLSQHSWAYVIGDAVRWELQ